MTQELRDLIDDLVDDAPTYVVPDARSAWTAGARRRTRRRVGVGAAAVVVLALLASAVAWLPRTLDPAPAGPDGAGVDGYPARLTTRWPDRDLPIAPGPMAMVYGGSDGSWRVAEAAGGSWRLPQEDVVDSYPPALSPDGRMLGYLADRRTYVVQDLVTGERTEHGGIGDSGGDLPSPQWFLAPQAPPFWSPSGDQLFLRVGGSGPESERTTGLVVGESGWIREMDHGGYPAGWVDDDSLVFLHSDRAGRKPTMQVVDVNGRADPKLPLQLPRATARHLQQWSGSVSPDGSRLAVATQDGGLITFSTSDGRRLHRDGLGPDPFCGVSWQDQQPVFMQNGDLVRAADGSVETLTVVDPDLDVTCVLATADALAGDRNGGLLGTSDSWLSWHVRQVAIAVGVGAVLIAVAIMLVVRRRRKSLAATS